MGKQRRYDSCSDSENSNHYESPCSSEEYKKKRSRKSPKRSPKRSPRRRSPRCDSDDSSLSTKYKIMSKVKCADNKINKKIDHLKQKDYELVS